MSARKYADSKWSPEVRELIDSALEINNLLGNSRPTKEQFHSAYQYVTQNLPPTPSHNKPIRLDYSSFLLYADHRIEDSKEHPGKIYGLKVKQRQMLSPKKPIAFKRGISGIKSVNLDASVNGHSGSRELP